NRVRCKPVGPAGGRDGWEWESLRVFNTRQESGNGTRVLGTGSLSVLQYGTRIPRLGPTLPAVATWKWEVTAWPIVNDAFTRARRVDILCRARNISSRNQCL